jgi:hypothetical protein
MFFEHLPDNLRVRDKPVCRFVALEDAKQGDKAESEQRKQRGNADQTQRLAMKAVLSGGQPDQAACGCG